MNENILNSEELAQLVGGVIIMMNKLDSHDVNNINSVELCGCIFNNSSVITNTNKADKCACVCM